VTSHHITAGHSLKNRNAGRTIHAIEIRRHCSFAMFLDNRVALAISLIGDMIGSSSMESLVIFPLTPLVVEIVIVPYFVLVVAIPFISDTGTSKSIVNFISLDVPVSEI